jgi:integrase
MEIVKKYVESKKPTLSKSSITTYSSILKNLYQRVFGDGEIDMTKFNEPEKVLKFLENIPANKRKTILSSLVIITDKKAYRDLMLEDVKEYNKDINKQEKTESQKENWVETNQVQDILEKLKTNAELIYKKKNLSNADLQEIQAYIIMCLLGGVSGIAPRRSKDFVDFKIKNIDKEKDNFLDKNKMYFNSYKTSSTYGQQVVDIPIQLKNILNKWIKINPTEYLLFDSNLNKLSSVKLNQRLNKLFNKKCSVNQLRHTYLTNKFSHTIKEKEEIKDTMQDMGSSSNMLQTYVKK